MKVIVIIVVVIKKEFNLLYIMKHLNELKMQEEQ